MSGSTIGGVVGAVVGYFVGAPQVGWMIGSAIGGYVDPERIEGPRLSDARTQTAQDGVARVYGYGTFPCAGNLIWVDKIKEHRKKESAKGGPEQVTYSYTISYAIAVCKGPISGYKIIKRNGKVVFDARPDAELTAIGYTSQQISETRAAQAAFLQKATFYYGDDTQMPDPTIVAVKGAGNVPAYTGTAYIVLKDDETREGEVSQYEFVVATCGERHEDHGDESLLIITGSNSASGNHFISAQAKEVPEFVEIASSTGANIPGAACAVNENGVLIAVGANAIRYSTDPLNEWMSGLSVSSLYRGRYMVYGPSGWLIQHSNEYTARASEFPTDTTYYAIDTGANVYDGARMSVYQGGRYITSRNTPVNRLFLSTDSLDETWDVTPLNGQVESGRYINLITDILAVGAHLYGCIRTGTLFFESVASEIRRSSDGWQTWPEKLMGEATGETGGAPGDPSKEINHLCASEEGIIIGVSRDCSKVWTSADGFSAGHSTGVYRGPIGIEWINETNGRSVVFAAGRFFIIGQNGVVSTTDGISFSAVAEYPDNFTAPISIVARKTAYGTPIPDAPGYFIDPTTGEITGPSGTQIDPCTPTLGSIVADQSNRRDVTDIDVSELTDTVLGYRIAAPGSPQRNIAGLTPGYHFDSSEFDGALHFPKRKGRSPTFALTMDDYVARDGEAVQWERTQEPELLRKYTVGYLDPETTYTATTQQWERRAGTVMAQGEGTAELPIVGTKDWAAQAAHVNGKIAWSEPDECTFHVSIAQSELVTAAVGTIEDDKGDIHTVRITRIEDEGLVRMVTGRRTRVDTYESTVSGARKPLPRFPGSNIRGPTDSVLMNLPIINDANDALGLHWAAAGMASGWAGAQLQVLRTGQWQVAAEITSPCGMGTLLSPLPFHAGDFDGANVLHVRFSDELESVTYPALLTERNPLAIVYPDGTAEIVQFQNREEIAPNEFRCWNLIRGNLDTTKGLHDAGARVVFLDGNVQWVPLQIGDIGQALQFRAVSLGTDSDAAPIFTLTLTKAESQREWAVAEFNVVQDGDDFHLSWIPRHRLGTDVHPVRSGNWQHYVVGYQYADQASQAITTDDHFTFNLPGASDVDFTVVQFNRLTGEGTVAEFNVP